MRETILKLSKKDLQNILLELSGLLSEKQRQKLDIMIAACQENMPEPAPSQAAQGMPQELIDQKMAEIERWMAEIDEGELYLFANEYEDYSGGYWDRDWITEYHDEQGIGDKLEMAIQFAKDCVEDRRYQEAQSIYGWLWEMTVDASSEYDCEPVDLETLAENGILHADLKQLALLTLYAAYQVQEPAGRAEELYLYFSHPAFHQLHIEDMFHVGRENLEETGQFLEDWIALLLEKTGDSSDRLLQDAVLYYEGLEGLANRAATHGAAHPALYLAAMREYEKNHDYLHMEETGKQAVERIDPGLAIRSVVALKAAYAASCLAHTDEVYQFCWEGFRSKPTARNFLRLFGAKEMAETYGQKGLEFLTSRKTGNAPKLTEDREYYALCFYAGDFDRAQRACQNKSSGALGWSGTFMPCGLRMFLLYLYKNPLPSKAADHTAREIAFQEETNLQHALPFEREITEESRKENTSVFWNYFRKWKSYFPVSTEKQQGYLAWAEALVYGRADALVSGQHRGHYQEAAALLAMVGEIKEGMGSGGAKQEIFSEYKRKFPRHSAFQKEMKYFFANK